MKGIAVAIVCLLVAMGVATLAVHPNAQGLLINDQLTEQSGSTAVLGGGDYVFVRFGSDAAFGVVYGSATNPNSVYLVALKARYLGLAQVQDQAGRQIASNRPVKIYTMYAAKLDNIVEFADLNGNGLADHTRTYDGSNFTYYRPLPGTDTFYKKVSLRTSWTRGSIQRSNGTVWRSWAFNVSASNLPYAAVANSTASLAGPFPSVKFTFHLNASLEQVTNATVPQWRVTVGTNGTRYFVTNAARLQNLTVSGKVVHYALKWDQQIRGWNYDSGNPTSARRLFLEFHSIVGNFIPQVLADTWIEGRMVDRTGEAGAVRYDTTSGIRTANYTTGGYPTVQGLRSPYLDFGGSWTRIARLAWVANSTVDGATQPLYGQILGGWMVRAVGENGNRFDGFVILGGLSFKGGNDVRHDPSVSTDVQADLDFSGIGALSLDRLLLIAGVAAAAVLGVLLLLFLVVFKRRRKGAPPMYPPMR